MSLFLNVKQTLFPDLSL